MEIRPGQALVYDLWAAGPEWVMLVHGLSSNAKTWWEVARHLTRRDISAVTVDLRSHGRSARLDGDYSWLALSRDLNAIMEDASIDSAVMVGQSWGASVVLDHAVREPDRVRGMIAVDGAHRALRTAFGSWEECEAALRPADIPPTPRHQMAGYIREAHPHWSEEGVQATVDNFREVNGLLERSLPIPDHMRIVRHLWDLDPTTRYTQLACPSAIVVAAETGDGVDVPAGEVIPLPGHHDLHVEQPEAIAEIVGERSSRWLD